MTITYADGTVREALPLSLDELLLRAMVAGHHHICVFTCAGGVWRTETGEVVTLGDSRQKDRRSLPGKNEFVCSRELARQLFNSLITGSRMMDSDAAPFYLFSAEKRRVRITVLPGLSTA